MQPCQILTFILVSDKLTKPSQAAIFRAFLTCEKLEAWLIFQNLPKSNKDIFEHNPAILLVGSWLGVGWELSHQPEKLFDCRKKLYHQPEKLFDPVV